MDFNFEFNIGSAMFGVALAIIINYMWNGFRVLMREEVDADDCTDDTVGKSSSGADHNNLDVAVESELPSIDVSTHNEKFAKENSILLMDEAEIKMKVELLTHLEFKSIELVDVTNSPYKILGQIVNILIGANQVFKQPKYTPQYRTYSTRSSIDNRIYYNQFDNLFCYTMYCVLWMSVLFERNSHTDNKKFRKLGLVDSSLIPFLLMQVYKAPIQFTDAYISYNQKVSIIKFQIVELLLERLSTLTRRQRHRLVTFLLETVSDDRTENEWLRRVIALHFNCRLEGPDTSEERRRLTVSINSIIDADHIITFAVKDDCLISSSTKRDLVKMARYAFDDTFQGLEVEEIKTKMKKVLKRFYHYDGNNGCASIMDAFVYVAKNTIEEFTDYYWRLEHDFILKEYRKMFDLFKVALVDIGINPNSVDERGNTALHYSWRIILRGSPTHDIWNYIIEIIQLFIKSDFHLVHQINQQGESILDLFDNPHRFSDADEYFSVNESLRSAIEQAENSFGPQRLFCLAAAAVPDELIPYLTNEEINYPEKLIDAIFHHRFSKLRKYERIDSDPITIDLYDAPDQQQIPRVSSQELYPRLTRRENDLPSGLSTEVSEMIDDPEEESGCIPLGINDNCDELGPTETTSHSYSYSNSHTDFDESLAAEINAIRWRYRTSREVVQMPINTNKNDDPGEEEEIGYIPLEAVDVDQTPTNSVNNHPMLSASLEKAAAVEEGIDDKLTKLLELKKLTPAERRKRGEERKKMDKDRRRIKK